MAVKVEKDKKGACYIISHKRCGYHEHIFLTPEEMIELHQELGKVLVYGADCKPFFMQNPEKTRIIVKENEY